MGNISYNSNGYYDYQTQLYKMGARYYNSTDARWTQLDPSGAEYGYVYAGANPVNFVDSSGYFSIYSGLDAAKDGAKTGSIVGGAADCVGGAIGGGITGAAAGGIGAAPGAYARCIVGSKAGALQGAIVLGIATFIYGGFTGENPYAM
ncbi:MAG TPA: RHS repeat-associated core domain-containing protein [Candidatus Saccharimonadales bacterium]